MRLLKVNDDGRFSLVWFPKDNIPPYAILSHTWGRGEDDEVTFKDVIHGSQLARPDVVATLQLMSGGTQLISGVSANNYSQLVTSTVQGSVYFGNNKSEYILAG
jgi:hypothetical protein